MKLSINIPAYKEAKNLSFIIPQLISVLSNLKVSFEINIIDTIEKLDNTKNICKQFKEVNYYNRVNSNSFGSAYRKAIEISKGEFSIFMDADGSHEPYFIKELFKHKQGYDIVIASRYINGGGTDNSMILTLMSKFLNIMYSTLLGLKCNDISNSFKLYNTKSLKNLNLVCNNFDIVEEILYKLKVNNSKIQILELPYTFKKRMYGETKRNLPLFILTFTITLLKLRFFSGKILK